MLDIIIKGGKIVDGLGDEPFVGDIGIKDGVIAELGGNISSASDKTINSDGAIVTPGFVDIHTHFDGQVTWDDKMDPSFSPGVTSVVMGNCGVGLGYRWLHDIVWSENAYSRSKPSRESLNLRN